MTLRRKILLALILLAGAGLVTTDIVLYVGVRSYLFDQIDNELLSLSNGSSRALGTACNASSSFGPPSGGGPIESGLPANSWVGFVAAGETVCQGFLEPALDATTAAPHLPGKFGPGPGATAYGTYFDTNSPGETGTDYRMVGFAGTATSDFSVVNGTLIVAIPTTAAEATLRQILEIEVIATLTVLVAIAGGSWWLIRLGLRPLEDMTKTADSIAAGDLSQRVTERDDRTEIGRLGAALNTMLGQIETAFAARERSESRLRRFVADASHELRTPLTSIRGYAELFRRGAANRPDDLANSMRRIEEEATRMGVLVEELLQLARLDLAAGEEHPLLANPVDLAALARDAVSDVRAADPARTIELLAGPSTGLGDEAALRQLIGNLLANASHHTPPGTPVTVTTGSNRDTATAFVEVADAGPGMSVEDASHVFERFWRADPARTRGHAGAGLGLAIVAAIAETHRGNVTLETSPGAGCRFRFTLPAAEAPLPTDPPADSQPAGSLDGELAIGNGTAAALRPDEASIGYRG